MRLKLLFIIESLGSGGKERRLIELLKGIHKNHNITLIIMSNDIHYNEICDFEVDIVPFERNFLKDYKIFFKFYSIIKIFNPHLVHCWDNIAALHFGFICKFLKIPFINSMISSAPQDLVFFSKRYLLNVLAFPISDVILSNSQAGLTSFNVPQKKAYVIKNGFDINRLNTLSSINNIRKKLSLINYRVVGMVASFTSMKDYQSYIKAAELILEKRKDVVFLALGDGPNLEEIKSSVSDENKDYFRFLGNVSDVESIINAFDIGVLSTYTEGISNSILEYMAFAKPVVATDGGGTNEIVVDNKTGFLVRKSDYKQLAEKISFLLENDKFALRMGKQGRERIIEEFSIEKMIESTLNLYVKILNN